MSIFSNIAFLEGEQAEAYKKKKEDEAKKAEDEARSHFNKRYGMQSLLSRDEIDDKVGNKYTSQYFSQNPTGRKAEKLKKQTIDAERVDKIGAKYANYEDDPGRAMSRMIDAAEKSGMSTKQMNDMIKALRSGDLEKVDKFSRSAQGQDFVRHTGMTQAYDAANRHARRHPDQYKECGLFESVTFLND